jgi:hypothetical protein
MYCIARKITYLNQKTSIKMVTLKNYYKTIIYANNILIHNVYS